MREIDLSGTNLRTDLIIDDFIKEEDLKQIDYKKTEFSKDIILEEIYLTDETAKLCKRLPGRYKSLSFKDITDSTNFLEVEKALTKVLSSFFKESKIDTDATCLLVGLGNIHSTPDALGPKTVEKIIVTHHLLSFGELEKGYRDTSILIPGVTGTTGIETKDIIFGVLNEVKPDFIIVIDALKTTSTSRMNTTIQVSDSGISPGSGVYNQRAALNFDTLHIPVISIGIPTIIDSVTIVTDTLNYLLKMISYDKDNPNDFKRKMAVTDDYKDYREELSLEEREKILGYLGGMDDDKLKTLFEEVLNPLDYNFMVTPKEIDFLIERLSKLLSSSLNHSLHQLKRQN